MTHDTPPPSGWIDVEVTATDATARGRPNPAERPPPARPVSGRTVVVAMIVALLALTVAVLGLLARSRTVTATTHTPAAVPLGVDASGCPLGRSCFFSDTAEAAVLEAVDRALDFPTVIISVTVSDVPTSVTYRTTLIAILNGGVTITTTSQCVPGGAAVPARSDAIPARGPADGAIVVPGEPGCSVAVVVRAPAGAPVPVAAIDQIGHDASAQLRLGR